MVLLQILPDGGIAAIWVLGGLAAITSFFVVRTLNRVDKVLEKNTEAIYKLNELTARHEERLDTHEHRINKVENDHIDEDRLGDVIVSKLRALQGR